MTLEPNFVEEEKSAAETFADVKNHNRFLTVVLTALISCAGWFCFFVKAPVQAQVFEGLQAVHEFPVTKMRMEKLEEDVRDIKRDVREERADIKALIERFDNTRGR